MEIKYHVVGTKNSYILMPDWTYVPSGVLFFFDVVRRLSNLDFNIFKNFRLEEKNLLKTRREINSLIQKIYEDNVNEKISEERFATMSMAFEDEQKQLKTSIPDMEQYLETETNKSDSLQRFIDMVKCITQLTELTPETIHEFIDKIVVSNPE